MSDELIRLTATEAVARLRAREITPLDLIDAAAARIARVEPEVNALPTLCLDRARDHAKALMRGERREAEDEPGWLAGLQDRMVGRALALLHRRVAHRWTTEELAREVGLSRSAFAERFTTVLGTPSGQLYEGA